MKPSRRNASSRSLFRKRKGARHLLGVERLEARYTLDASVPTPGSDNLSLVQTVADVVTVDENTQNNVLSLLANDSFSSNYSGARKISSVSVATLGGTISLNEDGTTVRYTPPPGHYTSLNNANDNGLSIDRFTYVVDGQYSETVQVNVRRFLRDDSYSFLQNDGPHVLTLLANDNIPVNYPGPRKITALSATTAEGTISLSEDGRSVVYQSATDFVGIEQFSYVVDGTYDALVRVSVATPVRADYFSVLRNNPELEFAVRQNDCFDLPNNFAGVCIASDVQQITSLGTPNRGGVVRIGADGGSIFYRPAAGFVGGETFSYVADGKFQTTVYVNVASPDDTFHVVQNSEENPLNVLENDYFPAGYSGAKQITHIQQLDDTYTQTTDGSWQRNRIPANSEEVRISSDGQRLIFTPMADFVGSRTYVYKVDGAIEASVNVFVLSMLQNDSQRVLENSAATTIHVLSNDAFPPSYIGAKKITSVTVGSNGATVQVSPDGKWITYQPARGFYGNDVFTYTVDETQVAEVSVLVQRPFADVGGSVYQYTVANPLDALRLQEAWRWNILSTYVGAKKITAVGTPDKGGSVSISANGEGLIYTPLPSFSGVEKITFTVDGDFSVTYTVNVLPGLEADSFIVQQNGSGETLAPLMNDRFSANYGGAKKITALSPSENGGIVTLDAATQTIRYTPAKDFYGIDAFTYTVDGVQTARVELKVVRGVRDDRFHVAGDSQSSLLPVLVNDDFGRTYGKAKLVTAVSATSAGGAVSIAGDGRSLLYTPAAGFTGVDRFTYVVDGQYTAKVTVSVNNDRVLPQPKFATESALTQDLLEKGEELYGERFGKTEYNWPYYPVFYDSVGMTDVARSESLSAPSHSDTNVQVAGVDEGDIVETDGNYIYVLTGNQLVIVDSFPVADAQVVARYPFTGTPVAEFLNGDKLTVISQSWQASPTNLPSAADYVRIAPLRPTASTSVLTLTVLDISDRSAPRMLQETKIDGTYFESRAMGNYVYLALRNDFSPPTPTRVCQSLSEAERQAYQEERALFSDTNADLISAPIEKCVVETREQYRARSVNFASDTLPYYTSYDKDGNVVRTGLLLEATNIYGQGGAYSPALYSLVAFDITSADPGPVSTMALLTGSETYVSNPPVLFASKDNLYLFAPQSTNNPEDTIVTQVWQVRLDRLTGDIQPIATGQLPGTVLNQFSIDEENGYLRVATTNYSLTTSGTESNIFVLREDYGELEFVGSLQDLAPTETIYSVRFFDDRAIVVTFREIDPLFAIDLSDPALPFVAGTLKLPGYSNYIQPLDRDHVLTFGRSGPNGGDGPPQVSLFNIQDLARPTLIDQALVGTQKWSADAWQDHHAVAYFPEYNVLALPLNESRWDWRSQAWINTQATLVFKLDLTHAERSDLGIVSLGKVESDSTVRRNVRIADSLYSISDSAIQIVNVLNPLEIRGEVYIAPNADDAAPTTIPPGATSLPTTSGLVSASPMNNAKLRPLIAAVRNHLATHGVENASSSVIVTAERAPHGATDSFQIVARNSGKQYLYEATENGSVVQLSSDFVFSPNSSADGWHNSAQPMDSDGDGFVAPIDVLVIINELNRNGPRSLMYRTAVRAIEAPAGSSQPAGQFYFDVNQDGHVAPNDVLLVVNYLNRQSASPKLGGAEGEEGDEIRELAVGTRKLSISGLADSNVARATSSLVLEPREVRSNSINVVSASSFFLAVEAPSTSYAEESSNTKLKESVQALDEVLRDWDDLLGGD